jgi:hypothetical protein
MYNHIEPDFWLRKWLKDKSTKVILGMIRLVMFQNGVVIAQFLFYRWQIDEDVRAAAAAAAAGAAAAAAAAAAALAATALAATAAAAVGVGIVPSG